MTRSSLSRIFCGHFFLKIALRFSGFGAFASRLFRDCVGGEAWVAVADTEARVWLGNFELAAEGFGGLC